jgi:hypothetical protein
MKKIGIITLTRQTSLAYAALRRIVKDLGYLPVCGEQIGADSLYFSLEDLTLVGHDFLADLFKRAGFSEVDTILISAPYSVNLFVLPKVIQSIRTLNPAPIILGGNESSNNHKNLLSYRFSPFANRVTDVAPDFIVRGSAETVLYQLLPLIDRNTMIAQWDRGFFKEILGIPNIVFWLPERAALVSTVFSSQALPEKDIFSFVRYGEKTIAITLQRACIWSRKSRGGCLFCAIASQFGDDFHCAVQSDFFIKDLAAFLQSNSEIRFVDIWDDTFNIEEQWSLKICDYLQILNKKVGRDVVYSCFLRPKGITERLAKKMRATNFKTAFIGADALTEELSKRLRRGCAVSDMNRSIETLSKEKIQPRLSVQLFTPESTVEDVGITCTVALSCIKDGQSTVHLHLYTFPLYGSDMHTLLEARKNLKKIPAPISRKTRTGFDPYFIAYDYVNYDPDVEEIKKRAYKNLGLAASFSVRTYPGEDVDAQRLKEVLLSVRDDCLETKKTHFIKSHWYLMILLLEGRGNGLRRTELLALLSQNDATACLPEGLKRSHGNFGYAHTLSRSFEEVMENLLKNGWVSKRKKHYQLAMQGVKQLRTWIDRSETNSFRIASYGEISKNRLMKALERVD